MLAAAASKPPQRNTHVSEKAPKNISVFLRVRPPIAREITGKHTCDNLQTDPNDPTKITLQKKADKSAVAKTFSFNRVWEKNTPQKQVYEDFARGAVDAAFEGLHGVLFVYGQTGSGKTFTISNEDKDNLGVLQQSMLETWGRIAKDKDSEYSCSVSYVQLYNEILTDLLDPSKGRVRLQTGAEGRGDVVMVSEVTGLGIERTVTDYLQTMDLFRQGMERKEMQSTDMNTTSSRSHTIFSFHIHKATKIRAVTASSGDGLLPAVVALEGRLVLCDLAGSERISKTHAQGELLTQASFINGSLLVLGKVVAALIDKKAQHAPFRESKLTRLLQYSLQGNGNTNIVVNVSPSDDNTDETLSAIQFGQRAMQIKQEAKRHEVLDYKALYLQLQADLETKQDDALSSNLEEQRRDFEEKVGRLKEELRIAEQQNEILKRENEELRANVSSSPAGAAGGSKQKDPSPPRPSSGTESKYTKVIDDLRAMVKDRDRKLEETNAERLQLGRIVADEQLKALKLGKQLGALMMRYQKDMEVMTNKVDDLNAEVVKVRGTDYLTIGGGSAAMDAAQSPSSANHHGRTFSDHTSALSSPSMSDSSPAASGGAAFSADALHRNFEALSALRQENADLSVYQRLAEKAIKFLHTEKELAKIAAEQESARLKAELETLKAKVNGQGK
ncbi:kinesin, putative [Bodo saltans]|uniref:Kinesin-like protein n=1 Tax=Bodo saltans TaxID=75058 RepID=A0A0S4JEF6_BODSA|nr:kinesin, putative [Bodo saltans]|eukprot:CUG88828.1 kinesin, putative [Bodo saltans]